MRYGLPAFAFAAVVSGCGEELPLPPGVHLVGQVDGATHAIAIAGAARTVAEVRDGAFEVTIAAGRPTALVFAEGTRLVGVWRDGALDSLAVAEDGLVDLGRISFDGMRAGGELAGAELLAAIGMDEATAATVGALDDLCVRYANPDVDGDGVIDGAGGARLELRAELTMTVGDRAATIDDLVGGGPIGYRHVGTAITVRVPDGMRYRRDAVTVAFDAPFHGVSLGAATPVVPAGEPVPDGEIVYGVDRRFGVYARAGHDVPRGGYRFITEDGELAFVEVRPPGDAAMAEMMDQVMPFVTLVPRDAQVASIDLVWMRRAPSGWVALTDVELGHVRPQSHLHVVTVDGGHLEVALPGDAVSTSIPWEVDPASFAWIGIQTETAIGMKTYANVGR